MDGEEEPAAEYPAAHKAAVVGPSQPCSNVPRRWHRTATLRTARWGDQPAHMP